MSNLRKPFLTCALLLLLCSCEINGSIVETVNYGNYFLVNHSSYDLTVDAGDRDLLTDTVPAGQTVHFFDMVEGTGGHVFPSNAFNEFRLLATLNGAETVVYSGVNNDDWEEAGYTEENHAIIRLTVTDAFLGL